MRLKSLLSLISAVFMISALSAQNQDGPYIPKGQFLPAPKTQRSAAFYEHLEKSKSTQLFYEDFEAGQGSWITNGSWQVGNPTSGPGNGYNSPTHAATNLSGEYNNYANDWLISPQIALPDDAGDIILNFHEWFSLESGYDFGKVKISTDGGSNWTKLHVSNGTSSWRETVLSLTTYKGQNILLGFNLTSDGTAVGPGWYIDNINIEMLDPSPLEATLVSLSSQLFPLIYMSVAIESYDAGIPTLDNSNFEVFENDILQTNLFQVTPPEFGGAQRLADIIVVLDVTGSMGPYISAVKQNLLSFINALGASDINYNVGFVTFGDIVYVYNNYNLYSDLDQIMAIANAISLGEHGIGSGGDWPENQLGAMAEAAQFNFRPGAQRIQIMITDAPSHENNHITPWTVETLINNMLVPNNISVFPVFNTSCGPSAAQYIPIANATNPNGTYYHIYDNFNSVLIEIGEIIGNTYIVRYSSNNPDCDDVLRNVEINVNHEENLATANGSYMPCQAPVMYLTDDTADLPNFSWEPNTSFTIEVNIIDNHPPYVNNVMLFYKNSSSLIYQHIIMTNTGGNIWSGIIPGDFTAGPGLDYYITASDGQATYSLPSVNPANNPYQIAILPNVAPVITHDIIATASPGNNIPVSATVVDTTNNVEDVKLYYRKYGDILFQVVDMTNNVGNVYNSQIPSAFVTTDGIEYYIKATDDFGVSSSVGSFDDPIFITVSYTPLVPISNWALYLGFLLIVSFIILRFRNLFQ